MAINWKGRRRSAVQRVLQTFPKESGSCDMAAKKILPFAKKQDATARKRKIRPKTNLGLHFACLAPRVSIGGDVWVHHITVEVEAHCVDALTTVDGTQSDEYLDKHFLYSDCIESVWEP
jgi:hypothetical protein